MNKDYGQLNKDIDEIIIDIKEYTRKNFSFNHSVVYYADEYSKEISQLPKNLYVPNAILDKSKFATPYSHLLHIVLSIGYSMSSKDFEKVLRTENELVMQAVVNASTSKNGRNIK